MNRSILFLAALLFFCFIQIRHLSAQDSWQSVNGPYAGTPIAFGADSIGNLFVATRSSQSQSFGVFRSTDHGGTWQKVFNTTNFLYGFYTTPTGTIFLATIGGGYRSSDNGSTWQLKFSGPIRFFNYNSATSTLFAGGINSDATGIIYKSTDNGDSWTYVSAGTNTINGNRRIVINRIGHMYLSGSSGGVFRSTDNGATWKTINFGLSNLTIRSLYMTALDSVFAGTSNGKLFRLKNADNSASDTSWTDVTGSISGGQIVAITSQGSTILTGTLGGGLYRSIDHGATWTAVSPLPSKNISALLYDKGNRMFLGLNQYGIYQSNSSGIGGSWFATNQGFLSNSVLKVAVNASGHLFAATDAGGLLRSTDNGANWANLPFKELPGGASYGTIPDAVNFLFVNPRNNEIYARLSGGSDSLRKSTDNGNTWSGFDPLEPYLYYVGIDSTSNHMIAFWDSVGDDGFGNPIHDSKIYHSTDNGTNWTAVFSGAEAFTAMAVTPNGSIFAGSSGGVYRSTNDGANWIPVSAGLTNTNVSAIGVNGQGHLFAGTSGGGIYRSTNNGSNWLATSLTGGFITDIQKLPNGSMVATSTDRGALFSSDGITWSYITTGVTSAYTPSMAVLTNGTAFLGTFGEGIYKRTLFNTFSPTPILTHNTGIIKTSITRTGNIGYVHDNATAGDGFSLNGENYLQIGGLVMGTGPTKISGHLLSTNAFKQADTTFSIIKPGSLTREQGYVNFNDSLAASPMGILIQQESYADSVPGHNGFIVVKYRIRNLNQTPLTNFHIGSYKYWVINTSTFADFARSDSTRNLIYDQNDPSSPTRLFGVKLLSSGASTYYNVNSQADLGFTNSWNEISGANQLKSADGIAPPLLLSTGPYTIPANGYIVVGYAMLGGINQSEFLSRADSAQALWSRLISPSVTFSAGAALNFSNTPIGNTNPQNIHITNTGDANLTVTGFSIKDTNTFKIIFSSSFTLAPSADTVFSVNFKPGAAISYVDTLRILGNTAAILRLTGTGTAPVISLSPATYDFGQQKLGTPIVTSVKLKNTGNGSLNVTNVTVSPDTVFKVTSSKSFSVIPGDSTNILVQFSPTAENTYIDTLKILSNTNTSSYVLKGTGTQLVVGFNQGSIGTTVNFGNAATVTIKPSALIDASGFARLFYKQGGAAVFDSVDMIVNLSDTTYSAQIPAGVIGTRGVAYYIKVKFANVIRTAPSVNPQTAPYTVDVLINGGITNAQNQPIGSALVDYRIISIPLNISTGIPDSVLKNFGIGGKEWTLFRWQSGAYVQYSTVGFQNFTPGAAYWFITNHADKLKSGAGQSVSISQNFAIDLQTNWNMIGNPFNFNVAWSDVVKSGNIGPLWKQDVSSGKSDYVQSLVMKPWEGYFVKNSNSSVETITIPPAENTTLSKLSKIGEISDARTFQQGEWQIHIKTQSGTAADNHNYIGMLSDADNAYDEWDLVESPRQPTEFLKLYFPHPEWNGYGENYGYDIRKVSAEGSYWDFEINSNSTDEKIDLEFYDVESVPSEFQIEMIDKDLHLAKNVREDNRYTIVKSKGKEITRHFRIVIGTANFVKQNDLGMTVIPTQFDLSQNFPNPFNPTTTLKYAVPFRSIVEIKIYNILGQEVKTLVNFEVPAGYYLAIWDSKNNFNEQVSSGIYIYRISARALDGTKQNYIKSKKMLLLK